MYRLRSSLHWFVFFFLLLTGVNSWSDWREDQAFKGRIEALHQDAMHQFEERLYFAHQAWLNSGHSGAVANLPDFQDGSIDFNRYGFPVNGHSNAPSGAVSAGHTGRLSPNYCGRLWNQFLMSYIGLHSSGIGSQIQGVKQFYESDNKGVFKVVQANDYECLYSMVESPSKKIRYDAKRGRLKAY